MELSHWNWPKSLFNLWVTSLCDKPFIRNQLDKISNYHGNILISLCKDMQLKVLNGRFLGDSLGFFTLHNTNCQSTVDYMLATILNKILKPPCPRIKVATTQNFPLVTKLWNFIFYLCENRCRIILVHIRIYIAKTHIDRVGKFQYLSIKF
jgi:hypothetical protein